MIEYKNVLTVCPYCGCGCNFYLQVLDGNLVGVLPSKTDITSQGKLCIKGWNASDFVDNKDRLTKPLIKKEGKLVEISWDKALDIIVNKFKEYNPDEIAVLSSAKCTNEENYLMMKFARSILKTNNVDHCARLCHASTVVGLGKTFGSGAMTNSIREFENADCIFIIGSNTTEQHPLISRYVLRAKEKGARLIIADPRRIPLTRFADCHLRQRPGTDVALLNGMMNIILNEKIEDKNFIQNYTENFEELKAIVKKYTPHVVEKITGIPDNLLIKAARMYAEANSASLIYSMGITQHTTGVDNVVSCANLAMFTGNVGRESTGVNPLRGQNNVQGACDMGALPNVYSGYQSVSDENIKTKFEKAWNTELSVTPGLTIVEMLNQAETGNIKAMYIMGENPMLSDPDINHVEKSLKKLEFLVVQDIFLTETAQLADMVLPATSYAEKDGTFTATDRRVQRVRKAIEPIGNSKPDWQIICELAEKMGSDEFKYASPSKIMDEIAMVTPIYQGIDYNRIEDIGLQWPCLSKEHTGTPYLHKDKFSRGKGKFFGIEFKDAVELPDNEFPFVLTTGRTIFHYHTGTMTRRTASLNREVPEGYAEMNHKDAERLNISNGEKIYVSSRRGKIEVDVHVGEIVPEGIIFIPFHFSESPANMLTNPAFDPVAKIPELKVCAVKVEKIKI